MNAQQLKNAILQEAIEGRLVPQDPNDEPASVLLDKVRKEKAKLVKEKKLKPIRMRAVSIEQMMVIGLSTSKIRNVRTFVLMMKFLMIFQRDGNIAGFQVYIGY